MDIYDVLHGRYMHICMCRHQRSTYGIQFCHSLIYALREVHTQRVKRERNGMNSEKVEGTKKMGRKKERRERTARKLCLDNAHLDKRG